MIDTERLILDSKLVKELNGIIRKLNDEVDMLDKQKNFLQSKLRQKGEELKTSKKRWEVCGYYTDEHGSWTLLEDGEGNTKKIKGV